MNIEIEIKSPDAKNDIYELRNYLRQHAPDINLSIKEEPPQEGQMALGVVIGFVLNTILHVSANISLEELYHQRLKPLVVEWVRSKKKTSEGSMEVLSTLKDDTSKIHFLEDSDGRSQIFNNVYYAIDTERTRAVLIGTGEFDNGFPPIPPVKGNMEDFFNLLTDKIHIGLPQQNVAVAFNKTNTEIEELLLQTSRLPDTDTLIIYFAGHGHRTDIKKLYLIARNTRKIDDYILGGIDFDFINNAVLKSSTARQKILILDACHSGIATQGSKDMIMDTDVKGTYILASSPGDEVSYFSKNGRNTYFTGALIDVLKNGIDNSSEMLTLDDLYDYSKEHLNQKNFPHPIFKSELNIPPANFSIARNPAFSLEKLKSKISQMMRQGKAEDALYEYRMLLNNYPDDVQLRKDAAECETQVMFTRLVQEADELFFHHRDYIAAAAKYKKALQVKDDVMILGKVHKCEEYTRLNERQGIKKTDEVLDKDTKNESEEHAEKRRVVGEPKEKPVRKIFSERKIIEQQNKDKPYSAIPFGIEKRTGVIIALSWLAGGIVFHFLRGPHTASVLQWFYTATLPFACVAIILLLVRWKKLSTWEIIIYANGLLPALLIFAAALYYNGYYIAGLVFMVSAPVGYLLLLNKIIPVFTAAQFIIACIALVYIPVIFFIGIFYKYFRHEWSESAVNQSGCVSGFLTAAVLIFLLYKKWKSKRENI